MLVMKGGYSFVFHAWMCRSAKVYVSQGWLEKTGVHVHVAGLGSQNYLLSRILIAIWSVLVLSWTEKKGIKYQRIGIKTTEWYSMSREQISRWPKDWSTENLRSCAFTYRLYCRSSPALRCYKPLVKSVLTEYQRLGKKGTIWSDHDTD